MKIRTGFVSNSSSSSFCIFGFVMNSEDISKLTDENYDILEQIDNLLPNTHTCMTGEDKDVVYVGVDICQFPFNKTPEQVAKESCELDFFKQINADPSSFSFHTEGWYNG